MCILMKVLLGNGTRPSQESSIHRLAGSRMQLSFAASTPFEVMCFRRIAPAMCTSASRVQARRCCKEHCLDLQKHVKRIAQRL